ncbi:MAG: carboxypeptidase regulatory-like domain-containing protein [Bryobacteraceae bacterium]|jgi:hypothetical protein
MVGTVTDPSGAIVPGANVTVANTDTGVVRNLKTEPNGQFVVPDLRIGHYVVRVLAQGFKIAEKRDIVLQVGARLRVDFALEVGAATESISVEANPIAVQSDTTEVSSVITGQQVTQIATANRSIYKLAVLTPGVADSSPGFSAPTAQGSNTSISFNGLRSEHNLYMADGAEQDDRGGASRSIIAPSMDAIAEFRVLSSNYDAEYGLSSSATITMVFKSGTKDFHASAWEFVRNDAFDANDFFRNQSSNPATSGNPAKLRLNTFGFNVGGPVTLGHIYNKDRNKTFFFYNMEWRKMIQQGTVNTTVPDQAWYTGNLSSLTTQLHVPTAAQLNATELAKWAAAGYQPGAAITNNQIPASLINPNATALLQQGIFPAANSGHNYIGGVGVPTNLREELLRVDHRFSDKFWVFGHWVAEPTSQSYMTPIWGGTNVPTVGSVFSNPSYTGVIHATYTISPTLLSESAFNYDGNRIAITPTGIFTRPSGLHIPELFPDNKLNRNPGIVLGGSTGTNYDVTGWPWNNSANDYQIREDVSWTKGAHQLKMGASWAIYKKIQDLNDVTQGRFNFNGAYLGNDFADFLVGYANNYHELALQDAGYWNAQSWAAYFQDNWRVNKRLTLNLGLRWDGIPHTYEANHRMSNFYPNVYNPANAAILNSASTIDPSSPGLGTSPTAALSAFRFYLNGVGTTGVTAGAPNGMTNNHWNNWGPRVGLAFDLTGNGKTILRMGAGAMYERVQGNDMYNAGGNVPFSAAVTNSNVYLSNPGMDLATGQTVVNPIAIAGMTAISLTDYKNPSTWSYSAGIQQQIGRATVLQAAYVGNKSTHQFDYRAINVPDPSQLPALINKTVQFNTVVPYRGFGDIRMAENAQNAHYNSLQVSVRSQLKDLSLQGSYTLSRSIDPVQNFGGDNGNVVYDPYNRNLTMGPSFMDATHIGVVSFVYDLPIFRHSGSPVAKALIGGWQLSGVWSFQSGFPLNITLGGTQGSNGFPSSATNMPDFNGTVTYNKAQRSWFTTSGFAPPAMGVWGNYKRQVRGPGRNNWNISMFKDFMISEARGTKFELRFESFNTFNHTQFNGVQSSYSSGQFGQVTSVWDPRELQLAAKFMF